MADNIVGGLFGMMPEDVAAQRMAAIDQQAQAFGRMSSGEAYKTLGYKAGNLLGQGLFGVNDPQMERVRQRQQMSQGIDFNDPESLLQAAQRANQMGDSPAAQDLYSKAVSLRKAQADLAKTEAETQKALREKSGADPLQQLLRSGRYTPESVAAYGQSGNPADLVAIDKLTKPTADFIAKAMEFGFGDKPSYGGYTAEQVGRVNSALLEENIKQKAAGKTTVTNVLPGVEKAGDVTGLRKDLQALTKPYQDQSDSANDAIDFANLALKSNNFAAVSSLSRNLAKASGEVQLSAKDVQAYGIDPSLIGRISDTVATLASGTPTVDTLRKLRQIAEVLKKKADDRISLEEAQLQETARVSGLFTEPQIAVVFRRRPGNVKTDFTSVAEAEAAKLPKGTKITINGRQAVVE